MLLWHYSSVDVLNSILSHDKPTLRATHIHHLNDSTELKHGLNALKSLFKRVQDEDNHFQSLLEKMIENEYNPEIYSFSLSGCEDSLYQWLAYCPNQGGISMGFEMPELINKKSIGEQELFYLTLPADPAKIQIPQYGKCRYLGKTRQPEIEWVELRDQKNVEANLLTNAMFLKHEAFHFEKEYRLFFHPMPDNPNKIPIKFQGNKPFIEFCFKPEVLKRIFISPRGNKELTERTVKKILKVNGQEDVKVIVSDIPFRD